MQPNSSPLDDLLTNADQRVKSLYERAGSPPTHQHGLVPETFEELQLAMEELQVATEELRQQNDALSETQYKLASERYRYAELFDSAPDPYFVTDVNGLIVEANAAAAELVNVTRKYIVGKPLASYIAAADKDQFRMFLATLEAQTAPQRWPLGIKPRHMEAVVPVLVSASAIRNSESDVVGLRWMMRDASVRLKIEEEQTARAVAENERAQLASLLDNISDPLFVVNNFWTVTIANKRCLEMWGVDAGESIGTSLWELFPALAQCEAGRRLFASAEERTPSHFQTDCFTDANGWVEMHVHPVTSGLTVYFRDITERREQEQKAELVHARDRTIAETLQRSLLVKPHREDLPGLEIGTVYQAAWKDALVGGDYFDAFRIDSEPKIALVVGDVTGKGLKAASYTAQMKYALRAFLWETRSPGAAMARLNDFIYSQHFEEPSGEDAYGRLVAMSIAVVNTDTGDVTIASAGGSPIILIDSSGKADVCDVEGMLIGVVPNQAYEEAHCSLGPGESLLMTTDGIVDARNSSGAFLGVDGLQKLATGFSGELPIQDAAASLLEQVRSFSGAQLQDDVCLLMACRR